MKNLKYIFLSIFFALSFAANAQNWIITDDTVAISIRIVGGETKSIDKDNAVVRIIPANTGLNTTAVDMLSIEHDGQYATRIPWNDVTVSAVSPSSVLDFRTKVLTILNNNSSGGGAGDMTAAVYDPAGYAAQVTVVDIQRTLNQAQALLASSGAAITAGQGYIIDNGGVAQLPTGISLMRVVGIDLPAGAKGFSANAQAYVTALSTYVPCTYDVASNTARFDYLLWAGHISQAGTDAPTIDATSYNISGETPTFSYNSGGLYQIIFTGGKLISDNSVAHFSLTYDGEYQGFVVVTGGDLNTVNLFCYRGGGLEDDRLISTYIEIRLVYTLN